MQGKGNIYISCKLSLYLILYDDKKDLVWCDV